MRTIDFEKAIEALGVDGLEVTKFSYGRKRRVQAVYARMGERTFLKWDDTGRGYCFDAEEEFDGEGQAFVPVANHPEFLDYRPDADFDLRFD